MLVSVNIATLAQSLSSMKTNSRKSVRTTKKEQAMPQSLNSGAADHAHNSLYNHGSSSFAAISGRYVMTDVIDSSPASLRYSMAEHAEQECV